MNTSGGDRGFLRGALLENLGLKTLSILCSLGFFILIRGSEREDRRFEVGVAHTVPPDSANRVLVKEPPTEISVTISGPRAQIDDLPRDLGTMVLDLSTGHEAAIEIKPSMIPNVPPGLKVEQVFPSRIEVRWDDVVSRELPIQVGRTGEPAKGYSMVGSVSTAPDRVSARGPRSVVDLMQFARAAPFDATELTEGFHTRLLALDLPPEGVEYDVTAVTGNVQIVREERVVPFKAVRVEVVGAPKAVTRPETVTVTVRGLPDLVTALEADQIVPRVELPADVDLTKPGSMMAKVVVVVADVDVQVNPSEVLVKW